MQTNRPTIDWDLDEEQQDLLAHYQAVFTARAEYSRVFAKGTHEVIGGSNADGYTLFERAYEGDSVIVGINLEDAQVVTIDTGYKAGTEVVDLYSGQEYVVNADGEIEIELPAVSDGGTVILAKEATQDDVAPVFNYDGKTSYTIYKGNKFDIPVVTATDDVDGDVSVARLI